MPRLLSFSLHNFKGAESVDIDVGKRNSSPVTTLIGLNESGKTTILEGMSYFTSGDNAVSSLFDGPHAKLGVQDLIPIHRKAAFTGKVKVGALLSWELADQAAVQQIAKKHSLDIDVNSLGETFHVSSEYSFTDSAPSGVSHIWDVNLCVRKTKKTTFKEYNRPEKKGEPDFWLDVVNDLERRIPRIAYFPTFLVDMPAYIYLNEHPGETAINKYYRLVIQDILTSIDPSLSIEKHVVKRIQDYKASQGTPSWFSLFYTTPSKTHVDSVFQKIANAVTREVIGSWSKVFQRPSGAKSVLAEWNVDPQNGDTPYVSFSVSDGESRYRVSERSLGFRWFFSFLLFTAFKQAAGRPTLFLFDEPAANLHAKAQAELLNNFSRIASAGNKIIYSTHSHHMINPRWLSAAYIVENGAIDYDAVDNFELNTGPTNITATSYRKFVSEHPNRTSYFQPVLEKLEYVTPEIIGSAPYLLVEGITDYYAIRYARERSPKNYSKFALMPGVGAGASGPLISYLIGRGEQFLVLLDDDEAGRAAASRYRQEWFLPEEAVKTLGDIDVLFKGKRLESLLSSATKAQISSKIGKTSVPSKKEMGFFLAECCAAPNEAIDLSGETTANFAKVLDYVEGILGQH